ncbi:bacillithiol biosynthesis cysteine-adding enzyme BshC [Weeksellaceae bacterium TAE3-ERU29]|nr:bacillithiol biosynthesis cysteine-adding enzyme BshC [Weeksellaceae bacterium TAE3-ERU29]
MSNIKITETGISLLIKDYLLQKDNLKFAYNRFPDKKNYVVQAKDKLAEYKHRKILCQVLGEQNQNLTSKQKENLELLKQENTVTVTTGHQLNLATGPLYFIYKILHTVRICDDLNKENHGINFVPIYWMATEDHDFEEINHFNLYGKTYSWKTESGGAVGELSTKNIDEVFNQLFKDLPDNDLAREIKEILKSAYFNNLSLAEATRVLVNQLLGEFGVLILDANNISLKKIMIPYFEKEIKENPSKKLIEETNHQLKSYKNQAYAREINLFYLSDNLRERIEYIKGKYVLSVSEKEFSQEELLNELHNSPEKFSPNVILRPLYQEVILPNIAYIGGGGEIAYWLQLKKIFEEYNVLFPMLVLRNSMLILPENIKRKAESLGLNKATIFKPKEEFIKGWVAKQTNLFEEIEDLKSKVENLFLEVEPIAEKTHKSFSQMLDAQKAKQIKGFGKMKKRLFSAEKKRLNEQIERFNLIYDYIFPKATWQERKINFIQFYIEEGRTFFDEVYNAITPFEFNFIILNVNGVQQR